MGLWRRLHRAVLDELGARGELDWTSAIVDVASVRAKRGLADRAEPGLSRQEGQQTARAVRGPGHPAGRRCVRGEHPRQPRPQATDPRDTRHPLPPRTTPTPPRQASRRQGVLLRRPPRLAARTRPHSAYRPPGASSRANGSAGTAGRPKGRSPGCSTTAASPSDTSGRAHTSSASQPLSPATRSWQNAPRETSSKAARLCPSSVSRSISKLQGCVHACVRSPDPLMRAHPGHNAPKNPADQ